MDSRFSIFLEDFKKSAKALVKSQLILSTLTFLVSVVGLTIVDVPYKVLIALAIALIDILPVLGSGVILVPWALYELFTHNTSLGIKLAVLYVVLILVHQIAEPLIRGKYMGFSPLISIAVSIVSFMAFGGVGLIIGPFLAAIATSAYRIYVQNNNQIDRGG